MGAEGARLVFLRRALGAWARRKVRSFPWRRTRDPYRVLIAELMLRAQSEAVALQIGDRQARESLESAKLRAEIEEQTQRLVAQARVREADLKEQARKLAHAAAASEARDREALAQEKQRLEDERAAAALAARTLRDGTAKDAEVVLLRKDAAAHADADRMRNDVVLEQQRVVRELEVLLLKEQSAATVAERQAVQRGLVEAMTALGDKIMLGEVAQNMNLVSLFKGKDVGTILREVLSGTRVVPTLAALAEAYPAADAKS